MSVCSSGENTCLVCCQGEIIDNKCNECGEKFCPVCKLVAKNTKLYTKLIGLLKCKCPVSEELPEESEKTT